MKLIKIVFIMSLFLMTKVSFSQDMDADIAAVANAKSSENARDAAAEKAYRERRAEKRRLQQEKIDALRAKYEAERLADKSRDQNYEDQLRQLQIESLKLDVSKKKTIVSRTNEYVDKDLEAKAADIDYVKSEADANRNVSEGTKIFLSKNKFVDNSDSNAKPVNTVKAEISSDANVKPKAAPEVSAEVKDKTTSADNTVKP